MHNAGAWFSLAAPSVVECVAALHDASPETVHEADAAIRGIYVCRFVRQRVGMPHARPVTAHLQLFHIASSIGAGSLLAGGRTGAGRGVLQPSASARCARCCVPPVPLHHVHCRLRAPATSPFGTVYWPSCTRVNCILLCIDQQDTLLSAECFENGQAFRISWSPRCCTLRAQQGHTRWSKSCRLRPSASRLTSCQTGGSPCSHQGHSGNSADTSCPTVADRSSSFAWSSNSLS